MTVNADKSVAPRRVGSPHGFRNREIVYRLAMGLVMAPAGAWVVWQGGFAFLVVTACCGLIASFEWTRMVSIERSQRSFAMSLIALCVVVVGSVIAGAYSMGYVFAIAALGAVVMAVIGLALKSSATSLGLGALYIAVPFGSFAAIRLTWPDGWTILLFVMTIVVITDVSAFLAGRGFGGPQLAPKGSPNKTWTGAAGAFLCASLAGIAGARLFQGDAVTWAMGAGLISVVAQLGDLLESHIKRTFGVKDASSIIPGHGGVLDRLDSLMAAVVFVVLVNSVVVLF